MFSRRKRSGPLLAAPYKRATSADNGRWVQESLQRQMFQDAFERDEVQIADCEVRMRIPAGDDRPVQARVVATDRALHARVTLGLGIHRSLRLHYDQVKFVEVFRPQEAEVEVTYFDPGRARDDTWYLWLDGAQAGDGFGATVARLVSQRAAARDAAATRFAEAEEAGRRSTEQTWRVAAAARAASADASVASEVA